MAIALRGAGAWTFGSASITPVIPTAQVTGDMMLLVATGKPFDAAWTAPGGWTSLGRGQSGTTAAGIDLGSMAVEVWYKEATSDTETNPLVTEGTPAWNVVGAAVCVFSKGAAEVWGTPVAVFGADEVNGTSISVTFASNPGGLAGDYVLVGCGINTDAMGPLTTDLTPAWTGITFGTADPGIEGESTTSGDMSAHYMSRPVNSGTSSAAPTATGTGTASGGADRLEAVFVRLRLATSASATATPSTVAVAAALPAPTELAGAISAASTVAAPAAVGAPTLRGTAIATPAAIAATVDVPTPTVQTAGTPATPTPATVAVAASVPAPTIRGAAIPTPATTAVAANVPIHTVLVATSTTVTPSTVAVSASLPSPTELATARVAPATVTATSLVGTPILRSDRLVAPATVQAAAAVGTVTFSSIGNATVAVSTVAGIALVHAPVVFGGEDGASGRPVLHPLAIWVYGLQEFVFAFDQMDVSFNDPVVPYEGVALTSGLPAGAVLVEAAGTATLP